MMKEESTGGGDGGGGAANNWARVCDTCRSAACTVYCRADSAYLCGGCDSRIHAANQVASRHERVWVCEACERAPAAFLCKADAASLCSGCDAEIHSANPLARRHHRVPILPFAGSLSAAAGDENEEDDDEATSWLLMNPMMKNNGGHINHNNNNNNNNQSNGFLFGGEVDEYLDLVEYNFCAENQFTDQYNNNNQQQQQQSCSVVPQKGYGGDSVVPVQNGVKDQMQHQQHNFHIFQLGLDQYETSISHSVSISSLDVGIVPDSTTSDISMCDISMSHSRPPKGSAIDLFSAAPPIQMPTQLAPMDREARVLRYREKKKTRKFEKTIRYASRKAYAETRPRIKGRFAKRTDVEVEVDQMFSATMMRDAGYGIVPSF